MDCNIRSYLLGCTTSTHAHHNAHDSHLCSLLLPGTSQQSVVDLLCFEYWFSLPCWFQTICLFLCVSYSSYHTPRWVNMLIKRKQKFLSIYHSFSQDSDTTHCSSPVFCASCPITLYKPWATLPYLCPQKQSFPLTKYIRKGQPLVLETPRQQFENEERKVLKGSQISW